MSCSTVSGFDEEQVLLERSPAEISNVVSGGDSHLLGSVPRILLPRFVLLPGLHAGNGNLVVVVVQLQGIVLGSVESFCKLGP